MDRHHLSRNLALLTFAFLFACIARPLAARPVPWEGMVDGVRRTALIEAGKNAATTPSPLVLVFHGFFGSQEDLTTVGLARTWPEATFVYPQGLPWQRWDGVSGPGWQILAGQ
jgi:hypothetical protein